MKGKANNNSHLRVPLQGTARKRSTKAGLPPGTLVHIGGEKTAKIGITVTEYSADSITERELSSLAECPVVIGKQTVTWIHIDGVHEAETVEKIGACFHLHPLIMEDIMNTEQRPKIDEYDGYLFVVLRILSYDERANALATEQVSMVVGPNYVISFKEERGDIFGAVRERIRNDKSRLRSLGADFLAYSLIDSVVDAYFIILEKIGEKIEYVEEDVIAMPSAQIVREIHELKREMIFLRRSVWPLREIISLLERNDSGIIGQTTRVYLKDVYDHTIQIMDTVETHRDIISGMLDIYLSSISNRLNEVMKVLTIISTIFIPLTFIAGVYGMNFKYMPELDSPWGYPLILLLMLIIGLFMVFYFRRKKWI